MKATAWLRSCSSADDRFSRIPPRDLRALCGESSRPFLVNQPPHLMSEVHSSAPLGHLDMPPASFRLTEHEQVSSAVSLVLVVISSLAMQAASRNQMETFDHPSYRRRRRYPEGRGLRMTRCQFDAQERMAYHVLVAETTRAEVVGAPGPAEPTNLLLILVRQIEHEDEKYSPCKKIQRGSNCLTTAPSAWHAPSPKQLQKPCPDEQKRSETN